MQARYNEPIYVYLTMLFAADTVLRLIEERLVNNEVEKMYKKEVAK
jgi:hypothetical protein